MLEMRVSDTLLHDLAEDEGYREFPYLCPTGHWTVGHGHLILEGEDFSKGLSREGAWMLLIKDAGHKAHQVWRLLSATPSQEQFDAMVALTYNTGVGVQDGVMGDFADSTLLKMFNAGNIQGAADEFLKWNKGRNPKTGKLEEIPGLTLRRQRDRRRFLGESA
jgi:GH24 family phage-related lysozyme (muramidase)